MHSFFVVASLAASATALFLSPAPNACNGVTIIGNDRHGVVISRSLLLPFPKLQSHPGLDCDCLSLHLTVDQQAHRLLLNGLEIYPPQVQPSQTLKALDTHTPPCEHSVDHVLQVYQVNVQGSPAMLELSLTVKKIDNVTVQHVPDVVARVSLDAKDGLEIFEFELDNNSSPGGLRRVCEMMAAKLAQYFAHCAKCLGLSGLKKLAQCCAAKLAQCCAQCYHSAVCNGMKKMAQCCAAKLAQCCAQCYQSLISNSLKKTPVGILVGTGVGLVLLGIVTTWALIRRCHSTISGSKGCIFLRAHRCLAKSSAEGEKASLMSDHEAESALLSAYADSYREDV